MRCWVVWYQKPCELGMAFPYVSFTTFAGACSFAAYLTRECTLVRKPRIAVRRA